MYQDYDKIQATLLHQWIKKNQIKFKRKERGRERENIILGAELQIINSASFIKNTFHLIRKYM